MAGAPNPDEAWPLIRRLFVERGKPFVPRYLLAFAFMAVVAATTAASAWLMRDVINRVFIDRDINALYGIAAAVIGIYFIKGVAAYGSAVVLARVGNRIIALVQRDLITKLLRQDLAFLQGRSSNEFSTILGYNAVSARGVLETLITTVGRDILSLIGLVTVMVLQDPWMSIVMLTVMPVSVLFIRRIVRRTKNIAGQQYTLLSEMASHVREIAQGFKVVKAFGMEERLTLRVDATIAQAERNSNKYTSLQARTAPVMETLGGIAIGVVILIGGWRVISQGEPPGEFFSFITALLLAYEPAKRLAKTRVALENGLVGVRQMYEFLDAEETLQERPGAAILNPADPTIRFEAIRFGYRPDQTIIDGMTLTAEGGKTTALVGLSGSGKTTLISLLLRFWDPASGSITVGGVDTRDVTLESLRAAMSYVGQEAFLFDGTIRDNIAAGRNGVADSDIVRAAIAAHADEFIQRLPEGYATRVGELGGKLSGGQRQRIAIARAFLRDAPILLLDEPTSALDTEAEAAIQQGLAELAQSRTTIVIAHRLSTIQRADKIVVIDNGRVAEQGTHAELLARGGLYARLHEIQFVRGEEARD
ncbi:MAG: ABC transporter ATP-binding protein [Hyphomicrobiaceae bacterium]|nr:ABC transporter ATP-binding protein [Hyphomicrobiaceae bacterium]